MGKSVLSLRADYRSRDLQSKTEHIQGQASVFRPWTASCEEGQADCRERWAQGDRWSTGRRQTAHEQERVLTSR